MSLHDDLRRAGDPTTPLTQLQYLAQNVPETRPIVAANPSTYPALLDWLAEFEDPDIHAALASRKSPAPREAISADIAEATASGGDRTESMPTQTGDDGPVEEAAESATDTDTEAAPAWDQDRRRWHPLTPSQSQAHAGQGDARGRVRTNSDDRPFTRKPAGIAAIVIGAILVIVLAVGAVGGILYATGHRDSGLGKVVADLLGDDSRDGARMRTSSPADTDNPAAADREGSEEAEQSLARPTQQRAVKEFPTRDPAAGVRPVPPAAYTDVTHFQVNDGAVTCTISSAQATCLVASTTQDYGNKGGPLRLTITSGGAFTMTDASSEAPAAGNAAVLAPSAAVAQGKIACQSSGSSVECWDAMTGHGFTAGGGTVGQF
ncbi:hypothetical protein H8R18_07655 [Nanchangia anserum]|uniref:Leucine rich repeat variant domain-containing protein n=1 Tax=Nanchangia anserum TaxID=2692125 RepID=A0A8I0GEJ1_9ACTO|nr:hypothetical protein [Nanchangia anserum]MBD3689397.1 hypothetical protein [Nanchangia anserum]QOX81604.1 hypothetical protein H8R18_07655 [Nanchangia anserum]